MVSQRELKALLKFIAEKHGLPYGEVVKIFEAPFHLQSHVMRKVCNRNSMYYPSLRIPYFGIFFMPSWKREKLLKLKNYEK